MRQWHIMIDTGPEGWRHPAGWDGYTSREGAERALAKARVLWADAKLVATVPEDNVYARYVTWGSVRGLGPVRTLNLHTRPNTITILDASYAYERDYTLGTLGVIDAYDAFANACDAVSWPSGTWCDAHGIDQWTDVSSYVPLNVLMAGEEQGEDPEIFAMLVRTDALLAIRSLDSAIDAMVIA